MRSNFHGSPIRGRQCRTLPVREVIPFPPDKTILSTQVLTDHEAPDGTTQRRVLVAAAHRDLIDGVVAAVKHAGLHVERVDLISSALVRALVDSVPEAQEPEAIVSVGAGLTVIVVHQQGRPQFVRTIGVGSNSATSAICSALDVPFADGEVIKRHLGEPEARAQSAEHAVERTIGDLVGEIRNSIQYYASLPGRSPIAGLTVTERELSCEGWSRSSSRRCVCLFISCLLCRTWTFRASTSRPHRLRAWSWFLPRRSVWRCRSRTPR